MFYFGLNPLVFWRRVLYKDKSYNLENGIIREWKKAIILNEIKKGSLEISNYGLLRQIKTIDSVLNQHDYFEAALILKQITNLLYALMTVGKYQTWIILHSFYKLLRINMFISQMKWRYVCLITQFLTLRSYIICISIRNVNRVGRGRGIHCHHSFESPLRGDFVLPPRLRGSPRIPKVYKHDFLFIV